MYILLSVQSSCKCVKVQSIHKVLTSTKYDQINSTVVARICINPKIQTQCRHAALLLQTGQGITTSPPEDERSRRIGSEEHNVVVYLVYRYLPLRLQAYAAKNLRPPYVHAPKFLPVEISLNVMKEGPAPKALAVVPSYWHNKCQFQQLRNMAKECHRQPEKIKGVQALISIRIIQLLCKIERYTWCQ